MDLKSTHPFWPTYSGLPRSYPSLQHDEICDVIILGGGITGAFMAHALTQEGLRVVLLDKRDVAMGSTSASTALLQYEIDTPLCELIGKSSRADAERAYWVCHESIDKLEAILPLLDGECGFQRKQSVYLASDAGDLPELEEEFAARKRAGFQVDLLTAADISARFSFARPGAILSAQAAEVDSYRLAHLLLARAEKDGAKIYDRTAMSRFDTSAGEAVVETERGWKVRGKHLVFATGYESVEHLPKKIVKLKSSFALVSEPLQDFTGWWERALLWETARPYLYMRTTSDGRALIGGADDPFRNPLRRDALIPKKAKQLAGKFAELFPNILMEVAYTWAGTFGETKDGLAYIGSIPKLPLCYFALGFGGNGITYSVVAAEMIRDAICGRENTDTRLFRFDR